MKLELASIKRNLPLLLALLLAATLMLGLSFFVRDKVTGNEQPYPYQNALVINEIAPTASGAVLSTAGNPTEFIELFNGTAKTIDLYNYGLSDRGAQTRWAFPRTLIEPGAYLTVYLTGTRSAGLNASFRLAASGGDTLTLIAPNARVIDEVQTIPVESNQTMIRDATGTWVVSDLATPGYPNTADGFRDYLASLSELGGFLVINEVLPRNAATWVYDGGLPEYIELLNTGSEPLDLANCYLSDTRSRPFRWRLPEVTLAAQEMFVAYTHDSPDAVLTTGFRLSSETGVVLLSCDGKIKELLDYDALPNGFALLRDDSANIQSSRLVSPGYPNDLAGVAQFMAEYQVNRPGLVLSEIANRNDTLLAQNGGQFYDWIELFNNSDTPIHLYEYALSTNANLLHSLPDVILEPRQYYVVMASGDAALSNADYQHLPFKLGQSESLYLFQGTELIDGVLLNEIPLGLTMGRGARDGYYYFAVPTPLAPNSSGVVSPLAAPDIRTAPGVYNDVATLTVPIVGAGEVHYTTDGSTPTASAPQYTSALTLSSTTVVKAVSVLDGITSEVSTASYVINENHTIAVMSVTLAPADFYAVTSAVWESDIEEPCTVELFELTGGGFQVPCGFRLFGGSARGLAKQSFALKFRSEYGMKELNYRVFPDRDSVAYNTLVLRSGSQDYQDAFITDVLVTSLVDEHTAIDVQAYRPVILYVNARYWGVYDIREKVDEEFIANHYDVAVAAADVNILRIDGDTTAGSWNSYNELVNYISANDVTDPVVWARIEQLIDTANLIDYWVAESFVTNNDIAMNCRFFQHPEVDDGRWRFVLYDMDYSMYNVYVNYFDFATSPDGLQEGLAPSTLLRSLMRSDTFRERFVERVAYQLNNIWTYDIIKAQLDEISAVIAAEMPRNQARWGLTMDDWYAGLERLDSFANARPAVMASQARSFFGLSAQRTQELFGSIR
ncbi:MAG: CotH kinase family protein [Propionibacteriaceae bacterium]|jgi:hypothetical protein|nr:CotH kinase family protein [Propionibacteriaceae bacterium]